MGYKQECKKACSTGDFVTVFHHGLEYHGEVINYDPSNQNDYSLTLEITDENKKKNRVVFPISITSGIVISYPVSKKMYEEEKKRKDTTSKLRR